MRSSWRKLTFSPPKRVLCFPLCPLSLATPTMDVLLGRMADFLVTGSLGEERGPLWGEDAEDFVRNRLSVPLQNYFHSPPPAWWLICRPIKSNPHIFRVPILQWKAEELTEKQPLNKYSLLASPTALQSPLMGHSPLRIVPRVSIQST